MMAIIISYKGHDLSRSKDSRVADFGVSVEERKLTRSWESRRNIAGIVKVSLKEQIIFKVSRFKGLNSV